MCALSTPFDLLVLAAAADAPFNVMHDRGVNALFDAFADYPVAAFSWASNHAHPSLADGHRRTNKAIMGRIPRARSASVPRRPSQPALGKPSTRWADDGSCLRQTVRSTSPLQRSYSWLRAMRRAGSVDECFPPRPRAPAEPIRKRHRIRPQERSGGVSWRSQAQGGRCSRSTRSHPPRSAAAV